MIEPILLPQSAFHIHPNIKRTLLRQNGETFDCVRELVTNSLDAHADAVWVKLCKRGDKQYSLEVQDNGIGMDVVRLKKYALTMFYSQVDDMNDGTKDGLSAKFGIGLFSILAIPGIKNVYIFTKTNEQKNFYCVSINPENLEYDIYQSDYWEHNHQKSVIKQNDKIMELDYEVPLTTQGTNVCALFESADTTLHIKIKEILKKYFSFVSRKVHLYYEEKVFDSSIEATVNYPLRINTIRPSSLIENNPLVANQIGFWGKRQKRYSIEIDFDRHYSSQYSGLFFVTGKGVTLASYSEYSFLFDIPEVKLMLSHCLIVISAKDIFEYPISRCIVYENEEFKEFMRHLFWAHILPFALDSLDYSFEANKHYSAIFVLFLQDIIGYLKSCEHKGNIYFPVPGIRTRLESELFPRIIFPLYNGELHNWVTIAGIVRISKNNELKYFNDRALRELLQGENIDKVLTASRRGEWIVTAVKNPNLMTYYGHCFNMVEVNTDYRFDELDVNNQWIQLLFDRMIQLGHYNVENGLAVNPCHFSKWAGSEPLDHPPLFKDQKKKICYVNVNSPLIREIIRIGKKDAHLGGHVFKKLFERDIYSVESRHNELIKDAEKRLTNKINP